MNEIENRDLVIANQVAYAADLQLRYVHSQATIAKQAERIRELEDACKAVLVAWGPNDTYHDCWGFTHILPGPAIESDYILKVRAAIAKEKEIPNGHN
jgi:hypothetical protein